MLAVLAAALLGAQLGLALFAWMLFGERLAPELDRKAEAVALSLGSKVERALQLGIPFAELQGSEDYFAEVRRANPEIAFVALSRADRTVTHVDGMTKEAAQALLSGMARPEGRAPSWSRPGEGAARGVVSLGLGSGGRAIGALHVGVRQDYLNAKLSDVRLDILVVLAISLLVVFEIARFAVSVALPRPTPALPRPASQIRLLAFLFMFGEQLSRPFLPVFAKGLLPEAGVGGSVWAGLPISAFMLTVAVSIPLLARWADRVGRRRCFRLGAAMAGMGMVGAFLCLGLADFTAWRMLTGIGYAMMFLACQGFVIDQTDGSNRARGVASFVGAIMVAELCAPGIGGILADRVGPRPVFAIGAGITVLAALLAAMVLDRAAEPPAAAPSVRSGGGAWRNARFIILLLTAAIPAKFALTAFLFYLVPVGLAEQGASQSEIGRIAMLYGLPSLAAAPLFARLADRHGCHGLLVGLGGMLTGAGFLPLLFWPGTSAMTLGVVALGLGQAMSISPQLTMATRICEVEIARSGASGVLGLYRFVERLGSAAGPLAAGLLTAIMGVTEAAGVLALVAFGGAVLFSLGFLVLGQQPEAGLDGAEVAP